MLIIFVNHSSSVVLFVVYSSMPKRARSFSTGAVVKRIKANFAKSAARRVQLSHGKGTSAPELKSVDVTASSNLDQSSDNISGSMLLLNGVAVGTDFFNRTGRKVQLKSVQLKGQLTLLAGGSDASSESYPIQAAIVYDDQPNGVIPVISDIFQAVDSGGSATSASPYTPINLNNRDRFKILKDWSIALKPFGATGAIATYGDGMHGMRDISFYTKLNLDMIFGGTGATIASIQTGALYFVTYQLQNFTATGVNAFYRIVSRVRYADA